MSEINWGLIATAFRTSGHIAAVTELKRQGYVIVPKEPTEDMLTAGEALDRAAAPGSGHSTQYADCEDHYGAMLAAAPKVTK